MSQATRGLITSAKPTPTRRSALSTGRTASSHNVSETAALPALPVHGIPLSKDCLEFQLAASLDYEARAARGPLKDHTPVCDAADARIERESKRLMIVCRRIWRKPVCSWSNLRDLAEVAYFWAYKEGDDRPAARSPMRYLTDKDADVFEVASAHLIAAVLKVGGANV